jgi:hypothetical protein
MRTIQALLSEKLPINPPFPMIVVFLASGAATQKPAGF